MTAGRAFRDLVFALRSRQGDVTGNRCSWDTGIKIRSQQFLTENPFANRATNGLTCDARMPVQPRKACESLTPSTVCHPLSNLMTVPAASSATLLGIISRNVHTEIGRRWNFAAIQSVDDFRTSVPLTDYEVYRGYIQRMIENGEKDVW